MRSIEALCVCAIVLHGEMSLEVMWPD